LIDGLSAMFQMRCQQKGLGWRVEWQIESRAGGSPVERFLVHGGEGKLRQVLINLLGNAVKFTESGRVILKMVRLEPTPPTPLPTREGGDTPLLIGEGPGEGYRFEIIDTGVGISPEDQAKIFDPFYQGEQGAKRGGTGLGLAISRRHIASSSRFPFRLSRGRFRLPKSQRLRKSIFVSQRDTMSKP
jgi:signal transduction histidine kinase